MKIGDRVRDRARGFSGTVIQLERERVLIEAENPPQGAPKDAPRTRVWQLLTHTELIDLNGKAVQGTRAETLDTAGKTLAADGPASALGSATNYDSAGQRIEMQ